MANEFEDEPVEADHGDPADEGIEPSVDEIGDETVDDEVIDVAPDGVDVNDNRSTNGSTTASGSSNGQRIEAPTLERMAEARRAIEAVLLVATDPTPDQLLAQLVELPADLVHAMCMELADEYDEHDRGFQLRRVAGGWRYQTNPSVHPYVERYALEGIPNRLSGAALETLSIVAYKQPISRGQIGAIRGVNVDGVLRTLVQRGYVEEHGKDDGPGQAALFGTTPFFLERLGIDSVDQLPPLGDFVPSAEVLEALEETLKIESTEQPVALDEDQVDEPAPATDEGPEPAGAQSADVDSTDRDSTVVESTDVESADVESTDGDPADLESTDLDSADVEGPTDTDPVEPDGNVD